MSRDLTAIDFSSSLAFNQAKEEMKVLMRGMTCAVLLAFVYFISARGLTLCLPSVRLLSSLFAVNQRGVAEQQQQQQRQQPKPLSDVAGLWCSPH